MRLFEVPTDSLHQANPFTSDSYRLSALDCYTVVLRWEAMQALKSERAKYLAIGIAMGTVFFFLLWAALL